MNDSSSPPQAGPDDDRFALQWGLPVLWPEAPRRVGETLEEWLLRLPGTPEHRAVSEHLKGIGTAGSPTPERQAVLYQLVRGLRPKTVLEIGTLFAGTTHVIARALWANGQGRVIAIDPFGGERVPPIIARMPPEIGGRIDFHPLSSMDFFLRNEVPKGALGLAFIDGDHSYSGAHFDLYRTSERIAPGGVIVLDNSELCGVAYATADFLERHPDWRLAGHEPEELGNLREVSRRPKGKGPLGMLALLAPPYPRLGAVPVTGALRGLNSGPYHRLRLALHGQSLAGEVEFSLFFVARDFNFHVNGIVAARSDRSGKVPVRAGESAIEIAFDPVLLPASQQDHNIELQYEIRFLAGDGVSGLLLAAEPTLL
ncbi:MAG: class I SAM-dependent methyltransferase [Alphaproteobacteria bacterium]